MARMPPVSSIIQTERPLRIPSSATTVERAIATTASRRPSCSARRSSGVGSLCCAATSAPMRESSVSPGASVTISRPAAAQDRRSGVGHVGALGQRGRRLRSGLASSSRARSPPVRADSSICRSRTAASRRLRRRSARQRERGDRRGARRRSGPRFRGRFGALARSAPKACARPRAPSRPASRWRIEMRPRRRPTQRSPGRR